MGILKKTFRFYITIFLTRFLLLAMKAIGKNATYFPGVFALKLCPDFLKQISKPEKIICVTGTNGKTTTTNMLADCLKFMGEDVACNRYGSNMAEGVISTLLKEATTFWGKSNKKIAVLEVDERSSDMVYYGVEPDYIVCSNLYRDTIRREANTDFVFELMDSSIPSKTTMVLNADDIISSALAKDNDRVYYGIAPLDGEKECKDSLVKDAVYDFDTLEEYEYEFQRYHHIGIIKKFSPKKDYTLTYFDKESRTIKIDEKGEMAEYKLIDRNETNLYNQLSVITMLRELAYERDAIRAALSKIKVPKTRYEETEVCGKKVIMFLSKGSASVAASRVNKYIAEYEGDTAIIMMNEEEYVLSFYNSWFYEIDYKLYRQEHIKQIVTGGFYCKDFHLCLLLEGVDPNKIQSEFDHVKTAEYVNFEGVDNIFVVYGLDTLVYKEDVKARLIERIKNEVGEGKDKGEAK